MKISLIGSMASGKSTVGQCLAKKLNLPFYDTDTLIESKMGCSVSDIFAQHGETRFRKLETETLTHLLTQPEDCIIATGGGIIKNPLHRSLLKKHSRVVFLDVSITTQLQRVEHDTSRPILMVDNRTQKLEILRQERLPLYQETAHYTLQVDLLDPDQLAQKIQDNIRH